MADIAADETAKKKEKAFTTTDFKVNEALFLPSEWDDYPLKRDDKHTNKVVQPDFAPFCDVTQAEPLPQGFQFVSYPVAECSDETIETLCRFLNDNADAHFLVDAARLRWTLAVPANNFPRCAHVLAGCVIGVKPTSAAPQELVGLIASRPVVYRIDGRVICSLEVVWMCTLKKFRGKRLAAVMMRELYRRAYGWGVSTGMLFVLPRQLPALYTTGPIRLLRRSLTDSDRKSNIPKPNKNIDLVRFANMRDVGRMMKIYHRYASDMENVGWRLYREYNRREFEHTFLKRGDVMTYVIRTDRGDVKDFVSLYALVEPASGARVAYIHFISFLNGKLLELFAQNLLYILARNQFAAVYIADVGGVGDVLCERLHFSEVSGSAGWLYQFNYNTLTIDASQLQWAPVP